MTEMQQGTTLVALMLLGWPFALALLYLVLPPLRATIAAFMFAWLFLPIATYSFKGFPEYDKMTATCFGAFGATLIFDTGRVLRFRPRWIDIPALVLCFCPVASSLSNGLGLYDGLSESLHHIILWGLPYFLGRIYFTDLKSLRELAIGVFLGGLVYVPFCLFEIRFSPQLHRLLYGYHQHGFIQTLRYGGFRPMVFLQHGLMVGMWMTTAALVGLALWRSGSLKHIYGVPMSLLVGVVIVVAILCKSTGAIALFILGLVTLALARYARSSLGVIALIAMYVVFVGLRTSGMWSAGELVNVASHVFGEDRAASLAFRIRNEDMLVARASQRPVFGWGGWNRSRIVDAAGNDISVTDSQWVIHYGVNGAVGLIATAAIILLPLVLFRWRVPPRLWPHPRVAPAVSLAVVLALWMIDNTVNDMFNPIYVLMAGGLSGLASMGHRQSTLPPLPAARTRGW